MPAQFCLCPACLTPQMSQILISDDIFPVLTVDQGCKLHLSSVCFEFSLAHQCVPSVLQWIPRNSAFISWTGDTWNQSSFKDSTSHLSRYFYTGMYMHLCACVQRLESSPGCHFLGSSQERVSCNLPRRRACFRDPSIFTCWELTLQMGVIRHDFIFNMDSRDWAEVLLIMQALY